MPEVLSRKGMAFALLHSTVQVLLHVVVNKILDQENWMRGCHKTNKP
jgi:hypothetical protein